ncbi:unnamed protein product [Schistosoma margrebowiei]|uniref:Secreted protein n=1 Tax=Schistosoma margrebowiei TaxID=48269 RepID=A0AA85AL79_9TREM|nr:unnamed protein product [Schistosoma margrebowiei]
MCTTILLFVMFLLRISVRITFSNSSVCNKTTTYLSSDLICINPLTIDLICEIFVDRSSGCANCSTLMALQKFNNKNEL